MSVTYATLKAAIADWTGDDGEKLDDALGDTIISQGELRVLKSLNLGIFDVTQGINFSVSSPTVPKPTGHVTTRMLMYINGTVRQIMREKSVEFCIDFAPDTSATGTPLYYSDEYTSTTILVSPAPPGNVTGSIRFMKRPTGLSSTNANTWLGDNAGELLLQAVLLETSIWMQSAPRQASYEKSFTTALKASQMELRHLIRSETRGAT